MGMMVGGFCFKIETLRVDLEIGAKKSELSYLATTSFSNQKHLILGMLFQKMIHCLINSLQTNICSSVALESLSVAAVRNLVTNKILPKAPLLL